MPKKWRKVCKVARKIRRDAKDKRPLRRLSRSLARHWGWKWRLQRPHRYPQSAIKYWQRLHGLASANTRSSVWLGCTPSLTLCIVCLCVCASPPTAFINCHIYIYIYNYVGEVHELRGKKRSERGPNWMKIKPLSLSQINVKGSDS